MNQRIVTQKIDSQRLGSGAPVEFRGVTKQYGNVRAIEDLDLAIRPGEFLTLLGPSGSGKSTLLMLLAGFEHPTTGVITVDGQAQTRVPPNRRNQGIVFQSYALFPHMSVRDNLGYPLAARGIKGAERDQMIGRALERVRMSGHGDRYPSQLSGGQQQRVALARAIVFNPPLLLMDESLSALDRNLREEMQYELKELHEQLSTTIVFVTHDQGEALTMSDRVAVLENGRLVQLASPRALYDGPVNAFVARFVGDANFIEAVVDAHSGDFAELTSTTGHALLATSTKPLSKGQRVLTMVRPEALELSPFVSALSDPSPAGTQRLIAEVERAIFLGGVYRYWLRANGVELSCKVPCAARHPAFEPGEVVEVSIHAEDLRVIDA
ncbi:putative spermidine/putrescine transport system ATP-binding protein [Rhizobiales bacterium GAS113]|nr:putative spermidine/putrescine transport system ATP-binding protein [Rhizobiales bacterium GAS113]